MSCGEGGICEGLKTKYCCSANIVVERRCGFTDAKRFENLLGNTHIHTERERHTHDIRAPEKGCISGALCAFRHPVQRPALKPPTEPPVRVNLTGLMGALSVFNQCTHHVISRRLFVAPPSFGCWCVTVLWTLLGCCEMGWGGVGFRRAAFDQ